MKVFLWMFFGLGFLTARGAGIDPGTIESKVQGDLEGALSHLIARDQYLLQVTANTEVVTEKKIIEGETMVQAPETASVVVPPLPGFQPDPATRIAPPQQSRTTFKMVETPTLRALHVQLTIDERVPEETVRQAESVVRTYLHGNYGNLTRLAMQRVRMIAPGRSLLAYPGLSGWIATLLLLALSALWLVRHWVNRRSFRSPPGYRAVYDSLAADATADNARAAEALAPAEAKPWASPSKPLALPSSPSPRGTYPSLPTSPQFVDQRTKLLELFLKNSETFRLYFQRLGENAQSELYGGLRGPAFDSFLEGLGLVIPPRGEDSVSPSEEQMTFYEKNFAEFIQTNQWQHNRFFGFLQQLSEDQLLALVKQESPLVASILMKFMKPEHSAYVLPRLTSPQRLEILSQANLLQRISTDELRAIEEAVRMRVTQLPKFLVGSTHEDIEFWSRVLGQVDNQDEILLDLERTRPEIYPALAKFRFQLEDAPSLPKPLLAKVLDEADNQELALALLTCPSPLVDFLLGEVAARRRELLQNQLAINQGMPTEKTRNARAAITRRFREVMA